MGRLRRRRSAHFLGGPLGEALCDSGADLRSDEREFALIVFKLRCTIRPVTLWPENDPRSSGTTVNATTTTIVVAGSLVGVPTKSAIQSVLPSTAGPLNEEQLSQIQLYLGTLLFWNQKISITSLAEPSEILTRHFGESLLALGELPGGPVSMADLGSGAGFPGMVLKIARPDLRLHLIEQNAKKAAFLSEIARELRLKDVFVHRSAYKALPATLSGFDIVVSRALGEYKEVLRWSSERLAKRSGKVMLWIGSEEATRLGNVPGWRVVKIIPVSGAMHRVIFVGCPT